MYRGIPNKEANYKLYEAGEFGNRLRTWACYADLCKEHFHGLLTMRYAGEAGKWCAYKVDREDVNDVLMKWRDEGADMYKVKFNESAPDNRLVLQGEIQTHPIHKYMLTYSTEKTTMRAAMRNPKSMLSMDAFYLVQKHLSLTSMRNLKRLFATYPQAVVEFSAYDHMLGYIPNNNTIFWEVRNY